MKPEIHPIQTNKLPLFEGLPHIKRKFAHPPGMIRPERLGKYELYYPEEVDDVIELSKLSPAGKNLLRGLREKGGVAWFGNQTDFDLGLNYGELYKTNFDTDVMNPVLQELAEKMQKIAKTREFSIDGVLAPEMSGIPQGRVFTSYINGAELHHVKKNIELLPNIPAVAVDSYTKGKTDTISLEGQTLEKLKTEGRTNLVLSDDIIDAGFMTRAVALLLQLARKQGFDINLVGIVSPIEKTYTNARKKIKKELGKEIPIFSVLQIEDIGILNETQAWIKVKGIAKAIPCNLSDFRR